MLSQQLAHQATSNLSSPTAMPISPTLPPQSPLPSAQPVPPTPTPELTSSTRPLASTFDLAAMEHRLQERFKEDSDPMRRSRPLPTDPVPPGSQPHSTPSIPTPGLVSTVHFSSLLASTLTGKLYVTRDDTTIGIFGTSDDNTLGTHGTRCSPPTASLL